MRKISILFLIVFSSIFVYDIHAQAPAQSTDVMLQAFYWDSYSESKWNTLNAQASELAQSFSMIWLPPSNDANSPYANTMGYIPVYWFRQNSSFGSQDELKTLISNLNLKGTKCIADVVVNHRGGVSNWVNFPTETYNGVTFTPNLSWICRTDECNSNGYTTTGAADTGDDFGGARDLDHTNTDVQNEVKAYLQFLKNDIGFSGWRYDMTKGYSPSYTAAYNDAAGAYFSVGEYWDGNYDALYSWLQRASFKSTTFDFSFKYALNNWASSSNLTNLVWSYNGANQPAGLIHNPSSKRYGVTFIDNHDTYRDNNKFTGDVLMANAFMLSSPGIPCVFLPHWNQYKAQIQAMIAARKAVGVHSESTVVVNQSASNIYVATVTGKNGSLIVKLGSAYYAPPADYTIAASGNNYSMWIKGATLLPLLTVSPASGTYVTGQAISMSATESANIYYTTDGTTPTVGSTKYTVPVVLPIGTTTLKVIAINANGSSDMFSNTYTIVDKTSAITARFKAPDTWTTVAVYVWETVNGAASQLCGAWPGKLVSKDAAGYYTYTITNFTQPTVNVIFNNNNNKEQTVDLSTTGNICWKFGTVASTANGTTKYNADVDGSCTSAVENIAANSWRVYPNPTTGKINFDVPDNITKAIISSTLGAKIGEIMLLNKQVDISNYPSGMYFVTIYDENGVVATKPLMKR